MVEMALNHRMSPSCDASIFELGPQEVMCPTGACCINHCVVTGNFPKISMVIYPVLMPWLLLKVLYPALLDPDTWELRFWPTLCTYVMPRERIWETFDKIGSLVLTIGVWSRQPLYLIFPWICMVYRNGLRPVRPFSEEGRRPSVHHSPMLEHPFLAPRISLSSNFI